MRIVIVPGSRAKVPRLLAWPARACYRMLGVDTSAEDDEWPSRLKASLELRGERDVHVFSWDGGITRRRSLEPAARRLARMLEESDEETALFCKSLGGAVGEIAAASSNANVVRIVCVATPHSGRAPALAGIEVIDITSPADRYLRLGNLVLHRRKRRPIPGARMVTLPGLAHSDFNKDLQVRTDGEDSSLYALYARLATKGHTQRKVYERKAQEGAHAPRRRPRASRP